MYYPISDIAHINELEISKIIPSLNNIKNKMLVVTFNRRIDRHFYC